MLDKPPHIALVARLADVNLAYPWDEWHVENAYSPADPDLVEKTAQISHIGNVALATAITEWIVWRFEGLDADETPYQYIEAAWASVIHTAYARYVEFVDDEWRGVIRGPILVALTILIDLIWGRHECEPGVNAAWLSKLAELVVPDPAPFLAWRDACIERLLHFTPRQGSDPDDFFADGDLPGSPVPRSLFDLLHEPSAEHFISELRGFLANLSWDVNPFLNSPDEVNAFPDFVGIPYTLAAPEDDAL
jgi:hypothetical protein